MAASSLLRSNVVVAAGTALSRLTGLGRLAVFSAVIGQTALSDAYTIGNETPNIVYELLLGGVLSATLVPLFTSFREQQDEESTNVVVTVTFAVLAALTALAVAAAPLIFGLYTLSPHEGVEPDVLRRVGTTLTRIFLLQIFFYGVTAMANAVLQSRRRFFAAAWSPVLPNLIIIGSLLSLPDPGDAGWQLGDVLTDDRLRWTLGLGTTAGIATMAVVLLPAVASSGFRYRPSFQWRHPAVRRLLTLSGWTLGYVVANQTTVAVVRNLAGPGSGDAQAYFEAFTFFVLPYGLLAVSITTTFTPEMASAVARHDRAGFIRQAALGTRLVALLTMPAAFLLFALRRPVIGALLENGDYTAADAANTSRALGGFALGLVGFSVYLFVLRGFYAHQDTRTPFVLNLFQNGINIALALLLVGRYGILGLGAALAVSYLVCALWALQVLAYKIPGFPAREVLARGWPMLVSGALAGEAAWVSNRLVGGDTGVDAVTGVIIGGLVGLTVYVGGLIAMRVPEIDAARPLLARITRRARPAETPEPIEADPVLEGPSA